jgi:hypothetical protein
MIKKPLTGKMQHIKLQDLQSHYHAPIKHYLMTFLMIFTKMRNEDH